jgi:hypothetical protein
VTVHMPKFLTREEFDSFVEFTVTRPTPNIPAAYLTRLITLGYAAVTAKGPGAFSSLSLPHKDEHPAASPPQQVGTSLQAPACGLFFPKQPAVSGGHSKNSRFLALR